MTNASVPELSSLASALEEVTQRLGAIAENSTAQAYVSNELFEIERNLERALRRLNKLLTEADPSSS